MRKIKSHEKMWFGEGGYKKDFAEEGLGSILTRVGT